MKLTPLDFENPMELFAAFEGRPFAHLLSAGAQAGHRPPVWGNGTAILVACPQKTLITERGRVFEDGRQIDVDPFTRLRGIMRLRHISFREQEVSIDGFHSGAIGHIGYEMARWVEPQLSLPENPTSLPDMAFGFYDAALIFECGHKNLSLFELYDGAGKALSDVIAAPRSTPEGSDPSAAMRVVSSDTQPAYEKKVQACKEAILDGEIFQANLSRCLSADDGSAALSPYRFFCSQADNSSAAYTAFLQYRTGSVLSNSPERFFSIHKEGSRLSVIAEPVKGTRPRSDDAMQDALNRHELRADVKDRAENIMIVDLVRNDLSRVCRDNSVTVDRLCEVQSFTSVHHLVSSVRGVLHEGLTAVDVLRASFPCGSVTGAPKLRAMEVIAGLEQEGRGAYCGAIGFIDDTGSSTFSVAIRTAVFDSVAQKLSYRTGGGITLLSDPSKEYAETADKARDFCNLVGTGPKVPPKILGQV